MTITAEEYKAVLPPAAAQEYLENHLLLEGPGYFAGAGLEESLAVLERDGKKPTSWKEFVGRQGVWK